ncbi:MAG: hypothetical protein RLZZ221_39 [Verrucomicrobiota bacterium]|jgi:hypothetical protein
MSQRVFVALLTVGVFAAGYGARLLTEPAQPVPPAPPGLAREFAPAATTGSGGERRQRQLDRARLVAEIQKLRPQIEAYSAQVQEIDAEFDREFVRLLRDDQRERYLASQRKFAERDAKRAGSRELLSDEEIFREQDRSMTWVYWKITVTPRLEMLTRSCQLDAAQQAETRNLLVLRRAKFMALFDSTPHLGIRLSGLAPLIERVATPPAGR